MFVQPGLGKDIVSLQWETNW